MRVSIGYFGIAWTDDSGAYSIVNLLQGSGDARIAFGRIRFTQPIALSEGPNERNFDIAVGSVETRILRNGVTHGSLRIDVEMIPKAPRYRGFNDEPFTVCDPIECNTGEGILIDGLCDGIYRLVVSDANGAIAPSASDVFEIAEGQITKIPDIEIAAEYSIRVRAVSESGAPIGASIHIARADSGRKPAYPWWWTIDHQDGVLIGPYAKGRYLVKCKPDDPNKRPSATLIDVVGSSQPQLFTFIEGHDDTVK